ncbi:MAG: carboxymuconolactone decarboxylase family protein [Reyranellaceae bacterium]
MARISYYDRAKVSDKLGKIMDSLQPQLNVFRMVANSEPVARGFLKMGNALLDRGKLSPTLRELAILRVGWLSKASYEVYQHERIGRDVGLSEEKLRAIHKGADAAEFDEHEKAVLRFTDDVVKNVKASDATFKPVAAFLDAEQIVELTLSIGFYMMVSRFLETLEVDDQDGQAEWRAKYMPR